MTFKFNDPEYAKTQAQRRRKDTELINSNKDILRRRREKYGYVEAAIWFEQQSGRSISVSLLRSLV